MVDDIELYIFQLNERINKLKTNHKTSLYDFSVDFGSHRNEFCNRIEQYYSNLGFGVEIKKCHKCNTEADIILTWSL